MDESFDLGQRLDVWWLSSRLNTMMGIDFNTNAPLGRRIDTQQQQSQSTTITQQTTQQSSSSNEPKLYVPSSLQERQILMKVAPKLKLAPPSEAELKGSSPSSFHSSSSSSSTTSNSKSSYTAPPYRGDPEVRVNILYCIQFYFCFCFLFFVFCFLFFVFCFCFIYLFLFYFIFLKTKKIKKLFLVPRSTAAALFRQGKDATNPEYARRYLIAASQEFENVHI